MCTTLTAGRSVIVYQSDQKSEKRSRPIARLHSFSESVRHARTGVSCSCVIDSFRTCTVQSLAVLWQPNTPIAPRVVYVIPPLLQETYVTNGEHYLLQVRDCGSLLTVGGFNIPAVDVDDITIHYKDFKAVVNHIR